MSTVSPTITTTTQTRASQSDDTSGTQDFLLFYPSNADARGVQDAIHALYYLPKEYKLVAGKDASLVDGKKMTNGDDFLMDRILFETTTETAGEASPFSYADAVICGEADTAFAEVSAPHIVVSQSVDGNIEDNGRNGFTVAAGNPEALASAAMLIAKNHFAAA